MGERLREILLYSDSHPDPRFWCNTYEVIFPKRGTRRSQKERMKQKARRFMVNFWHDTNPDPVRVGRMASTHCRPCSCWMCRYPDGPSISTARRLLYNEEEEAFDDRDNFYWED